MIWVVNAKPMGKYPNDLGGTHQTEWQSTQMIWVVNAKPMGNHPNGLGG
ncbi:MAG: hypothetical protein IJC46_04205 [Clostridia bacterium]|nr:hypothetical protein [Clostridia bacterium]